LQYGAFMTFFPRLIAGPIVRPGQMLPQLGAGQRLALEADALATGLFIVSIGLFKKVVIADTVAAYTGPIFDHAAVVPFADAWGAALSFVLQVYFDFSGYSDMAVGLACMIGIRLPENFDSPYQARDIADFWRRWHITLATFLRDYLYIPLGGNRGGGGRQAVNVAITMLLCGLWHGAQWTAVAWGGLQAIFLVVHRLWRRLDVPLPNAAAWALTFAAILTSFAVFRSPTFERAGVILAGMAGAQGFAWDAFPHSIGFGEWQRLLPALLIVLWMPNRQQLLQWPGWRGWRRAVAFALLAGISILRLSDPEPFFYFQY
jgi:alginate O-acetyltransferase complex protein AlgI